MVSGLSCFASSWDRPARAHMHDRCGRVPEAKPVGVRSALMSVPRPGLQSPAGRLAGNDLRDVVERDSRSSVDEGDVVRSRRGQHPHIRLLAYERERSKPTKRQPLTLQLGNRRTQASRQVDGRRFIELWDVGLDQVRRRVSGGHRATVGRRASRRIAGNPTTRYTSASETEPSATRRASSVRDRTPSFR